MTFDSDKTILESLDTLIDTVKIEVNQVFRGQSYASDNPISGNCEIQIEILKTKMNNGARDVVCQVTLTSTTDSPYKWMMLTRRTAGMTSSRISMPLTPMITDVNKKYVDDSLKNKVDKVTGKGLSTVDFTKSYETKLKGLENYNDTKVKEDIGTINTQLGDIVNKKIDTVTFSDNKLTFLANNKTIKSINLEKPCVTTNVSGTTLTLTKDKYQTTTIADGTEIVLPNVTSFTEIHLFFSTTTDLTLTLPACKWQNGYIPTISANKTYEFIFTYTTEWLGGVISYE